MVNEYLDYPRNYPDSVWNQSEQKQLKANELWLTTMALSFFGVFYRLYNGGDRYEKYETKQKEQFLV